MAGNKGFFDRLTRIAVGLVLISLVYLGPETPWGVDRSHSLADSAGRHLSCLSIARTSHLRVSVGIPDR